MKRVFVVLLCAAFLVAFGMAVAFAADASVLTLEKAMAIAKEQHPLLSAAREKVVRAEAKLREMEAGFGPKVDAVLSYSQVKDIPTTKAFAPGTGLPIGIVPLGYEKTYAAGLRLTQLLFAGGSLRASSKAAEFEVDAARAEEVRTFQAIENGVRKSFFNLQRAVSKLKVAEEALLLAQEHLRQVEALYKNGVVAKNEVLRVQVAVSSAQLDRISAINAVDVMWKALERATGAQLRSFYELEGPESDYVASPLPEDPERLALASRADLLAMAHLRNAALAYVDAAAGQARPQVSLQGEVMRTGDSFFPEDDDWKVMLVAQWRLYDSGEISAKVAQARALSRELLHGMTDMERQISLEVSTAQLNLTSAQVRIQVAQDQLRSAEEDYRMALKRYAAQVGTNIDVLDSRLALNSAKMALVDAVYDAYSGYADLLFAVGLDAFEEKTK
jgi:outer membrane protein TolC